MSKQRYLVVYQHLPHYRHAIFQELENLPGSEFHFAADTESKDGSIPTLGDAHLTHTHRLRNRWIGPFLWQHYLLRLLLSRRWDAVIFLGDAAYISTWVGSAWCRLRGVPTLFWTIGWHQPDEGLRKHYRLLFYRLADRLLLYGETAQEIAKIVGYPVDRTTVIYNSIGGPSGDKESVCSVGLKPGPPTVGAIIRLNSVKRLDLLIDAAAELKKRNRPVRVLIVGEGPERARLSQQARELDVDLQLPGAAYDSASIRGFYETVSVTAVPSIAGLSVIQSMRYGRPVVTHNNKFEQAPEYEAIVDSVTGSLYREGDVSDLADKIDFWLSRQKSHAEETSSACHEMILSRWSAEPQAEIIQQVLHSMQSVEIT